MQTEPENQIMLSRREFMARPQTSLFIVLFTLSLALCIVSFLLSRVSIAVVDSSTALERGFCHGFGQLGMLAFGGVALFLASGYMKLRNLKKSILVLDEQALQYGGIRIRWGLIREAIVCKSLGRSFVGIRTINDRAMVEKINQAVGNRLPFTSLFALNFLQWRTQCSVIISAVQGETVEELQRVIEEYRMAFHDVKPPETVNAP